jgi:hypothetical protein
MGLSTTENRGMYSVRNNDNINNEITTMKTSSYECSVLEKSVVLELEYSDLPDFLDTLHGFNCKESCVECGVVTVSGESSKYYWNVCPAFKAYTLLHCKSQMHSETKSNATPS